MAITVSVTKDGRRDGGGWDSFDREALRYDTHYGTGNSAAEEASPRIRDDWRTIHADVNGVDINPLNESSKGAIRHDTRRAQWLSDILNHSLFTMNESHSAWNVLSFLYTALFYHGKF